MTVPKKSYFIKENIVIKESGFVMTRIEKKEILSDEKTKKVAMQVSTVSIVVNLLLSVFKLLAGIIGKSGAMVSDAIHSASDVFSSFIVIIGVSLAGKESDEGHQYGHDRLECVAAIILAVVLLITGAGIGIDGVNKIINGTNGNQTIPGIIAMVAAIISIATKEWMYWFTRSAAKKINSGAVMADAWHHRSDALSSIGALIGIIGARSGFPILDPIASVIICLFIAKAAYEIFKDAIDKMVDKSCDEEVERKMADIILSQKGVVSLDLLHTRLFGAKIYVDVEIAANGNISLYKSHAIAQEVHDAIEKNFREVKHCMVHVNPAPKFKGYLLCSDCDGTLTYGEEVLSEENVKAIKYFQKEGGIFTLATGRFPEYADKFKDRFKVNAPIVALNGTVLYDKDNEKIIEKWPMAKEDCYKLVKYVNDNWTKVWEYWINYTVHDSKEFKPLESAPGDGSLEKLFDSIGDEVFKILFIQDEEVTVAMQKDLKEKFGNKFRFDTSWPNGLEIQRVDSGKGIAVEYLKKHFNQHIHTTIGVGDQENDISLLQNCDIGYAVGNAKENVKKMADRVTVPNTENAIKAIIEDLDKQNY